MDFEKFYDKALRFLSYRPRSEKEVRENLKKKKASDSIIDLIIKKLQEQKFLNDKEFTRWWIEQRILVKPTGKRLIKIELRRKGIGKELIDETLDNLQDTVQNELEMARKLVQRKIEKYRQSLRSGELKGLERQKIYQRLGGFLSRRGFDYDTIKKSIDEALKEKYNF